MMPQQQSTGLETQLHCAQCAQPHPRGQLCPTAQGSEPTRLHPIREPSAQELEAPDPLLGLQVGSYQIVRQLGRGGMGSVYLGVHPHIGSKVAIKFLHESLATNPQLVRRFFAEARAVNLVDSDHVVRIYDLSLLPPSRYYIVMEYLPGRPLSERIQEGPLPLPEAQAILLQLCEALHQVHTRGIVHRDLKPDNIFLVDRGQPGHFVKVMDFGIAKLREASGVQTAVGTVMGTPEYMAPEQAEGGEVDARADVYALGVIAYELTLGRRPFTSSSLVGLLMAHAQQAPVPPSQLRSGVPARWEAAILRALAKRPEQRFPDLAAFAQELRSALAPAHEEPRLQAAIPVEVETARGAPLRLEALDVSRGGAFLACSGPMPELFTRIWLRFEGAGGPLGVAADVVRHISQAEAHAWRMRPGFAVQFAGLAPEQRSQLAGLLEHRQRVPSAPAPAADARGECAVLEYFRVRVSANHYELLGVALDADSARIRERAAALRVELDAAWQTKLAPQQVEQVRVARARVLLAEVTLCTLAQRLDYDAQRGNHQGIARCLASGVSREVVAAKHTAFRRERPEVEARVSLHLGRVRLARAMGNLPAALRELEAALALDALNLALHDALQALRGAAAQASK